jgi:2-methylcitrate dehydratase PrpD
MKASLHTVPLRAKLADFIHSVSFENIPSHVVHQAKLCLLDLIGVGLAGCRQKVAGLVAGLFPSVHGPEEATLWGSDCKLALPAAVLINAVQAHAIDMDDGHRFANGHPGAVTIPTAVALAEKEDVTGRELIESVIIGYEFFIRFGSALNPELLQRGFHTTATIGSIASSAAAAKLLRLTGSQTEQALALAALQSAGLLEVLTSGESGKSFQVGKAAQSGLLAAWMARQGADGPERVFEGEKGFFKAFSGKTIDPEELCATFGGDYGISGVYFKRHAACRHIHPALDALAEIAAESPIAPEEVEAIEIETYSIARNLTGHMAGTDSELGAKFSTPIAIGLYLVFGRSDAGVFSRANVSDPRVRRIAERVTVKVDPERDAALPDKRSARVTVRTARDHRSREIFYSKGEPEYPLTDAEMQAKFETNAGCLYSIDHARRLHEIIMSLDQRNIRDLTALLAAPAATRCS